MRRTPRTILFSVLTGALPAAAQQLQVGAGDGGFQLTVDGGDFGTAINIFLLITVLTLAPAIVMMMTSFVRIAIVISFAKQAMGTRQIPSPRVSSALALFLTFFIMAPVWETIRRDAIIPYSRKEISQQDAMQRAVVPIKRFMLRQCRESSLILFMDLAAMDPVESMNDLPLRVVIPAFMISELKTAFQMGFLIFLPFLVVDIVVATVLMSMGMMMLPPMMISMPFKLLLFIMVDGWELLVRTLVTSFF